MLDHPKIDIFIHMDAKNKCYDPAETLKLVKFSRVIHVPRIRVSWGGYSQVEAALTLIKAATQEGHYGHYHMLSGADLPIKKSDEIINFFERHQGVEFVHFSNSTFLHDKWVSYYYPLQEYIGREKGNIFIRKLNSLCLKVQKVIGVHRNKGVNFQKGSDWFSITDKFARYLLSQQEWIKSVLHNTFMSTEIYLHTVLINSPFRDNLYCEEIGGSILSSIMRLIDWPRGSGAHPYTFRLSDLDEIQASPAMFARKFHPSVDADIIERIRELYS